jgi:hypothetical protein
MLKAPSSSESIFKTRFNYFWKGCN